jgi:hypothetical protein
MQNKIKKEDDDDDEGRIQDNFELKKSYFIE